MMMRATLQQLSVRAACHVGYASQSLPWCGISQQINIASSLVLTLGRQVRPNRKKIRPNRSTAYPSKPASITPLSAGWQRTTPGLKWTSMTLK